MQPVLYVGGVGTAARVPVFGVGAVAVLLPMRARVSAVAFATSLFERGIQRETPLPLVCK